MNKLILLLASVLILTGCIATPYKHEGELGGYEDGKLGEPNTYWVEFKPNGYTPTERTYDYTLLRAADITVQNGGTHFLILEWKKGVLNYIVPPRIDEPAIPQKRDVSWMKFRILSAGEKQEGDVRDARALATNLRLKYGIK